MCDYKSDILVGFWQGIFGGVGVFIIKIVYDFYLEKRDELRIVRFLKRNTQFEWRTTHRIASDTNLPKDRVSFICSISKKIRRNEKEREVWELK